MTMASVHDMPAEFDTSCTFARLLHALEPLDYITPDSVRAERMADAIIAAPEKLTVSYCGITQCECSQQNPRNSDKSTMCAASMTAFETISASESSS